MAREESPRRLRALPGVAAPRRSTKAPRRIAVGVAVAGMVTLISTTSIPLSGQVALIGDVIPLTVRTGAASVAMLSGLGLLVVAGALARRQRQAWWIALFLLVVAGASHLVRDLDVLDAGLALGLAVVLVMARGEFDARPGPGRVSRALLTLPILATTAWGLGWIAIMANGRNIHPHPSAWTAAAGSFRGLIGYGTGFAIIGPFGGWIPTVLPLMGVLVVVVSFAAAFRPVVEGLHREPGDAERAAALVRRYGSDTLAYFMLREDKSYFFHGDVVIAYRYMWNLALVSGDPCGKSGDIPGALEAFVQYAHRFGWGVAILAGGPQHADLYAALGLRPFYLGDEALVDPRTFSLEGRPIRKVRQSCHRLERQGYTLEFVADADVRPDLRDALDSVTRAWRGRAPERGFTMALGRAPSPDNPECLTVVVRDPDGRTQGYLHLVPCFGEEPGFSLDQMRRRPGTPNGLTEWMVARTLEELGRRGLARLSLNFAFLGNLFHTQERLGPIRRAELMLARRLGPFFQIESLHDFNAKFFPGWIARYIYYEPPLSLPRVALAYLESEAFVRIPLIGANSRFRLGRRTPRPKGPLGGPPSRHAGARAPRTKLGNAAG